MGCVGGSVGRGSDFLGIGDCFGFGEVLLGRRGRLVSGLEPTSMDRLAGEDWLEAGCED